MHYAEDPFVNEQNDASALKMPDIPYRRRYVRVAVATTITYTRDGEGETKTCNSSDLGGGGIRVSTDEDLPLGAVLLLRFRVPNGDREVVARGRIVLSFYNAENKRFFHGVAFTQIDPKDQDEIVRYVAGEVQRLALEEDQAD
jgi:c-di-GMP-binding flagellar brake protein YcgR